MSAGSESRPQAAMVLAAGFGTRMRPLTDHCPKALLPVAGRTLLDRALDVCMAGGAARVVVNAHYLADQVRAHLATRTAPDILISDEGDAILETGGGLRRALPLLGPAPFFAVNADSVWTGAAPAPTLAQAWDGAWMDALLLLVRREDALAYARAGDFSLAADGRLARRSGDSAPFVYTGAQIVAPRAFDDAPEGPFSMNLIWDRLLARGRLFGVVHRGGWVDVGTPQGLAVADVALKGA